MNICPNCKNPVDAEDNFCANCGTALTAPQPVEQQEPEEQNQPVLMAAGLDGQPIPTDKKPEFSENTDNVPPYYVQTPYYETANVKKKSLLPIVLAAIGGVLLVGILVVIALSLFLCGGSKPLKWGMNRTEVVSVMLKEGFVAEDQFEEPGGEFEGYIDGCGEVDIDCLYNEKGELYYVAVYGEHDGSLDAFLDQKFGTYEIGVVMGSTIRYKEKGNTFSMRAMGSTETMWLSLDYAPQDALVAMEPVRSQLN